MSIENSVVFFPCSDIEKTAAFYTGVVGLRLAQVQAGGRCRIFDSGYGYLGFCEYGDGRPIPSGPAGVCISLNCRDEADVDRQYARLCERGATVLSPPRVQERFPVYACFFCDPDGYKVELQRILEGAPLDGGRREP